MIDIKNLFIWVAASSMVMCGCVTEEDDAWSLSAGDNLPDFSVVMADGDTVTSASLAGSVSVITFFNTGCEDCQRELPELQRAMEINPNVTFICIAREEEHESIERFWSDNKLTLRYSPQPDRKVYSLFASAGIPRSYVVSPDLVITSVHYGS